MRPNHPVNPQQRQHPAQAAPLANTPTAALAASLPASLAALASDPLPQALALASALTLEGALPLINLFDLTQRLCGAQQLDQAIALYRLWLEHTPSPLKYAVNFNLGVTLSNARDDAGAEQAYRDAIAQKSDFIEAHLNLGTLVERHGKQEQALTLWRAVLDFGDPAASAADRQLHVQALNNMGRLLEIRKQLQQAEQMLQHSLALDPSQINPMTHLVHLRQKQCEWPIYRALPDITLETMEASTSALALLSATDDPALQQVAARRYVKDKVVSDVARLSKADGYRHAKLRVGYLSSDFCSHAVSILTAELYELHDRAKIDVYGFCWSREDGTPMRARVVKALDNYVRIIDMSDEEAAQCIRAHEIDILVDLHGLTSGTRPGILAYHPAPVQMTYLGFPGSTGLPGVDYVLADRYVLPPQLLPFFTEKPLYLPRTFQINDRQRTIGVKPTRASCSLPDDAFVFCSFNNNFKITPDVFAAWMRILQRAPNSVLWLVADDESVKTNLHLAAKQQGVAPERVIFAGRVGPDNYLARYQIADLFLDTLPFNAGTTASDALWAGLPLLTCSGRTFASRMAGSLLHAVDLPQLVTDNLQDYEDKAVSLAQQPEAIAAMKQQLQQNRLSCALFDSPQFVRDLENLFEGIAVHPAQDMQQTPINTIHNVDVLNLMRPELSSVVEVGSSSGALALAFRQINPACKYVGIEIVEEYAEASRRHCTDVIFGNVEKISDAAFANLSDAQCWVFADALEHLYDPWQLLKRIKSNAKGPVEIIACIPNGQNWGLQSCLNSGKFIYQDSGLLDRTHIRWFTRLTIFELFQSAGFQITRLNARNFHAPSAEMRAAIRAMATATGADPDMAEQDAIPFQYVVQAVAID
jgi:predicted O-linked N-acetylglucosamine transferase (SPINDLY family)